MNPIQDISKFNYNSLNNAKISNCCILFGARVVSLVDKYNNFYSLNFAHLFKLAEKKVNCANNKDDAIDASKFFDRVIYLDEKSHNLVSCYDFPKKKIEEIKYNRLLFGDCVSVNINLYKKNYQKLNEELTLIIKHYQGNVDLNLSISGLSINESSISYDKNEIPERESFIKILEIFGNNIASINIHEYFYIDEELANKIGDHCPNLISLPEAFQNLKEPILEKVIKNLRKVNSIPEKIKDFFITKIDQYELKKESFIINDLEEFVTEHLNIIRMSLPVDVTDSKNAMRRQRINKFSHDLRFHYQNSKYLKILADVIDSYVSAAFFEIPDIFKLIFPQLLPTDATTDGLAKLRSLGSCIFVSKSFEKNVCTAISDWGKDKLIPLDAFGANTADKAVAYIKKFQLTKVNLKWVKNFNDEHLQRLEKCDIQTLVIKCESITFWPKNLSLKTFRPLGAKDHHIVEFVKAYPNLKEIDFSFTNINDEGLRVLGKACPNLEEIQLNYAINITDMGMVHLARTCPNLRVKGIDGTQITESLWV